jgi:hypothetical protein
MTAGFNPLTLNTMALLGARWYYGGYQWGGLEPGMKEGEGREGEGRGERVDSRERRGEVERVDREEKEENKFNFFFKRLSRTISREFHLLRLRKI